MWLHEALGVLDGSKGSAGKLVGFLTRLRHGSPDEVPISAPFFAVCLCGSPDFDGSAKADVLKVDIDKADEFRNRDAADVTCEMGVEDGDDKGCTLRTKELPGNIFILELLETKGSRCCRQVKTPFMRKVVALSTHFQICTL